MGYDYFEWTCPVCDRPTTLDSVHRMATSYNVPKPNADDIGEVKFVAIACPNTKCRRMTISWTLTTGGEFNSKPIRSGRLIPDPSGSHLPESVPEVIRANFYEAALIRELSPKASATLSRRALQGMIRDFWDIRKNRLIDEVLALKGVVDELTWRAIDGVREIGNIGAHMEKDVDLIIEVDPEEADALLELLRILAKDWYEARAARRANLETVARIAESKAAQKEATSER